MSETRSLLTPLATDGSTLTGYAALYNSPSLLLSERGRRFVETIAPTAFSRTLSDPAHDVTAHWTHDEDARPPLGRTSSGTLALRTDSKGLGFRLTLPEWAGDIRESVQRGDVRGMSFKFANERDSWEVRDGVSYRTLHDLDLLHVALVIHPAYPGTLAEVRSRVEPPEDAAPLPTRRTSQQVEYMLRII